MKFTCVQNVKTTVNDETLAMIMEKMEEEFKKISSSTQSRVYTTQFQSGTYVTGINPSFISIFRKDISIITVSENRKKDGYIINCETEYGPSVAFWIFCVFAFLLAGELLFVSPIVCFGLYFYNKSLVEKSIKDVLDKIKQNFE
ncbi:MAG: hypothetical protein ACI4SG_06005 [Oligosphaeraceae bacterium]